MIMILKITRMEIMMVVVVIDDDKEADDGYCEAGNINWS